MQNHSTLGRRAYWLRGPGPTGGVFPTRQPSLPRGAPPRVASIALQTHPVPPSGASFFPVVQKMLLVCFALPEQGKAQPVGPRGAHPPLPCGGRLGGWGGDPAKSSFARSENKAVLMPVIFPPPRLTGKAVSRVLRGLLKVCDPHNPT